MEHLSPGNENQGLIALSQRIVTWLKFTIVILIIAEVSLNCVNIAGSYDFPWQLAEGEYLLAHGQPEHSVLKAYGEISANFQNEYILYELLLASVSRTMGWIGLCVLFWLICFLIFLPCLWALGKAGARFGLIDLLLFLLGQFLINIRLSSRPELVADACYVITGVMLMSWPGRSWTGRQALSLGLVFCLWANAHGTFLIGLAMLGLWYGQLVLFEWKAILSSKDFRWLLPGVAAVIGCAVNPFGFYRLMQPFVLHGLLWGQGTSMEMSPATSGVFLMPILWSGIAILVLLARTHVRPYFWLIATVILLQYMTFVSIRYNLFIGLTLLVIAWDGLMHPRESFLPSSFTAPFALARLSVYFSLVLIFLYIGMGLFHAKIDMIKQYCTEVYPKTRLATGSTSNWLREHPVPGEYFLLSHLAAGSSAQMPGNDGVHPLMDSGTHRYSDRTNELHYYALASPETLRFVLSKLKINAVAVNIFNVYWAPVLNTDRNWRLVQIANDSQLYLRNGTPGPEANPHLFSDWEKKSLAALEHPSDVTSFTIMRGLGLRPDAESLQLLVNSSDDGWLVDPQFVYLKDWLDRVPDELVDAALQKLHGRKDNASMGLRLLFLLRLHDDPEAVELASQWQPRILDYGYQEMQMLRADAYLRVGDQASARALLDSFWPKPRYSLRWARLCQRVYADDPKAMPKSATMLNELADEPDWQDATIAVWNQNIERIEKDERP